jgi:hypothetical protein
MRSYYESVKERIGWLLFSFSVFEQGVQFQGIRIRKCSRQRPAQLFRSIPWGSGPARHVVRDVREKANESNEYNDENPAVPV